MYRLHERNRSMRSLEIYEKPRHAPLVLSDTGPICPTFHVSNVAKFHRDRFGRAAAAWPQIKKKQKGVANDCDTHTIE